MVEPIAMPIVRVCFFVLIVSPSLAEYEEINVTAIETMPFVKLKDEKATGNDRYGGFMVEVFQRIADIAKLKHHIYLSPDGRFGAKIDGGGPSDWNGMMGEVIARRAELAIVPLTATPARKAVVKFSEPLFNESLTFLVKKSPTLKTLPDLLRAKDMTFGVIRSGSTEAFLKTSKSKFVKKVWKLVQNDPVETISTAHGVQRVRDSNGAFAFVISYVNGAYYANLKKPCNLMILGEFEPTIQAMAINKESKYIGRINSAVREMKASGEFERIREKWWRGECSGQEKKNPKSTEATSGGVPVAAVMRDGLGLALLLASALSC